ncbi:MAG: SPOR domain-containing protein, partial [Ignavibacteriaceae bacterium]
NEPVYPPISNAYRTGLFFAGAGFIYAINVGNGVPYISVTAGYLVFDPGDKKGNQLPGNTFSLYEKETSLYSGEIGIKFPFSEIWSLNLGLNINYTGTDYLDDVKIGSNRDTFFSFFTGISIFLGKNTDIDNDGIDDDIDLCLETPEGEKVDEFGCNIVPRNYDNFTYDISKDKFMSNWTFTDGNLFCIQVDVFKEIKEAKKMQQKIKSLGYPVFIFNMQLGNSMWYSVRIGYFDSLQEARLFKEIFFKKTGLKLK